MGQVISYVKSFISNETDLNNNGVPDRDEIVKYVLEQLDKKELKENEKKLKNKKKIFKKLLK
tara:strand:+ start:750 stop:935 length:186 start_codon:yes stop_codon:yes gene_type:complete